MTDDANNDGQDILESSHDNPIGAVDDPLEGTEQDFVFEYKKGDGSAADGDLDPVALRLAEMLPRRSDWLSKTHISYEQVPIIASIVMLADTHPVWSEHNEVILKWIEMFLEGVTSVNGKARMEFIDLVQGYTGTGERSTVTLDMTQPHFRDTDEDDDE